MADALERLKRETWEANLLLPKLGLALFSWGNVSGKDAQTQLVVIKPSGVGYEELQLEHMAVVDMRGAVVGGILRPSSDLDAHLELYRRFPSAGGIAHTHSPYATAFAQAGRGIPCYGSTHADNFRGEIPCTRALEAGEVEERYELNTGRVIAELFESKRIDPLAVPAALVRSHGPFAWGRTPGEAAEHAACLEEVARIALLTEALAGDGGGERPPAPNYLISKHYSRKHGPGAYYGQK